VIGGPGQGDQYRLVVSKSGQDAGEIPQALQSGHVIARVVSTSDHLDQAPPSCQVVTLLCVNRGEIDHRHVPSERVVGERGGLCRFVE